MKLIIIIKKSKIKKINRIQYNNNKTHKILKMKQSSKIHVLDFLTENIFYY